MRTNHAGGRAVAAAVPFSAIRDEVSDIAATILREARNLTRPERQLLKDLQREGRYQFKWLGRLAALAARCPSDTAAFAMADRLRAFIGAARPRKRLTLIQAIEDETTAQAAADMAEVKAAIAQSDPGALARCEQSLLEHRAAIEAAIEAVQLRRMELRGAVS